MVGQFVLEVAAEIVERPLHVIAIEARWQHDAVPVRVATVRREGDRDDGVGMRFAELLQQFGAGLRGGLLDDGLAEG